MRLTRNPKLVSLSVTVLAIGAIQAAIILLALAEQTAPDGPRLDRYLNQVILTGGIWLLVALVDLFAFPTMRMTRLLLGPALSIAVVAMVVGVAVQTTLELIGDSVAGPTQIVAGWGHWFLTLWGLVSLWKLCRERVRATASVSHPDRDRVRG